MVQNGFVHYDKFVTIIVMCVESIQHKESPYNDFTNEDWFSLDCSQPSTSDLSYAIWVKQVVDNFWPCSHNLILSLTPNLLEVYLW